MNEQLLGVIRTLLAAGAGYISAKGYLDGTMANEMAGALTTLFVAGWSVFSKRPKADPKP